MHADRSSGGVSVSQACRDHLTADLHAGPVRLGAGDDAAQLAYEHYLALGRPDAASPRHDLHRAIISARP
jgi:hypothetical protein